MADSDNDINLMTIREFVEVGFLQEVNRQFFHPLGLALCVEFDREDFEATRAKFSIWDSRDDPEGFLFGDEPDKMQGRIEKMERILRLQGISALQRVSRLGYVIQPFVTIDLAGPDDSVEIEAISAGKISVDKISATVVPAPAEG